MNGDDIRYARGWIVTSTEPKSVPSTWIRDSIGPWLVSYDPRISFTVERTNAAVAAIIGEPPTHVRALLKQLVCMDDAEVQEILDRISGRYLILRYTVHTGLRVQQDALGLRAAYYTDAQWPFVIGSHCNLVAEAVGAQPGYFGYSDYLQRNNLRTWPGRATSRIGIQRLTPNTELSATTRRLRRLFPSHARTPIAVPEIADLIITRATEQLNTFADSGRSLMVSLSAGLDSRVSLALLRDVPDVLYFTYDLTYRAHSKASLHDATTASELARRFGLAHQIVDIASQQVPAHYEREMNRNASLSHSRALSVGYAEQLPGDRTHIRSNGFEVGRAYYRNAGFDLDSVGAREMRSVASNRKSSDRAAIDAFQEYINSTHFLDAVASGYDPLDLFYWEHRMGAWMTAALHESDIAHDTHILVSSREILNAMLSASFQDRATGSVPLEVIRRTWPELLEVPVNGRSYK